MKKYLLPLLFPLSAHISSAQVKWINVDSLYQPLPKGLHVFKTTDSLDGKPFIAYYAIADLKDKSLDFTVDTSLGRRLTPTQFYEKDNHPLLVVNTTFFSFETNRNLNVVIKDGKLVSYNQHSIALKGKDTLMYKHAFGSAIGINRKGDADIAWLYTDSSKRSAYANQSPEAYQKDSIDIISFNYVKTLRYGKRLHYDGRFRKKNFYPAFRKWKMKTAVGGGPVLVQNGKVEIANEQENKFTGKAINDKHPRTLMGYTADNKLIIMAIQGRFPNIAEGATLTQEAQLMVDLGCKEALNLDGGGSSCMLINGKETIVPSDKMGTQRAVPAVFIIKN
ncbi:phosphodiester glycosidase family protein [Ferruginibacter sp. HRS2-29]|uniref:phosphodiester glycosidase family protein n=1 Tax=Ferruginibacter sp. HRS2-29 TaxID=2487334 RepID=UPI0020CF360E|nr:phosphodiester glycosidase family protein [Ferruginibacter sp. HRS2-29]